MRALVSGIVAIFLSPAFAGEPLSEREENAITAVAMTFVAVKKCSLDFEPEGLFAVAAYGGFQISEVSKNPRFQIYFRDNFETFVSYADKQSKKFCDLAYEKLGNGAGVFKTLKK